MSFDEDDYYVWKPLYSDPYGIDCEFDQEVNDPIRWVDLCLGRLVRRSEPLPIKSAGTVRDVKRLDILTCSQLLILSGRVKDAFERAFGESVVWYPLEVHASDGVVSDFWAVGILDEASNDYDSDGKNILSRSDAGGAITFPRDVASSLHKYVGYLSKFQPLCVVRDNLPDYLK